MDRKKNIAHRGQWEGQALPNSFETFQSRGGGVEADVMLLSDSHTLAVAHPGDFGEKDEFIQTMSPDEFANLKVKSAKPESTATPFFREYVAGCYDRGIEAFFEIKGSNTETMVRTARRMVETIKDMRSEGAFEVKGKEHPEFWEQMGIHSFSYEAIAEAKKALNETGLRLKLGFVWLNDLERAQQNALAASAANFHKDGESWERSGLKAAKALGCDFIFFIEPAKVTDQLVGEAHALGLELYVYIKSEHNTADTREKLLTMKVDKLLY